jgi:fucose 4-O-acetylase-like acetyltransferase
MNRADWVDVVKGIGILAVVAGHLYSGNISKLIFAFHMPLFFFLGGYLYKAGSDFKTQLISDTVRLLLPYLTFSILVYYPFQFETHTENLIFALLKPFLGGRLLNGYTGVFWFITCYFLVRQVTYLVLSNLKTNGIIFLITVSVIIAYINNYLFAKYWFPWNANVVLMAWPIFIIGSYARKIQLNIKPIVLHLGFIISIVAVLFIKGNTFDMKHAHYGIPILTLFISLIIIYWIIMLSKWLVNSSIVLHKNIWSYRTNISFDYVSASTSSAFAISKFPISFRIPFFICDNCTRDSLFNC